MHWNSGNLQNAYLICTLYKQAPEAGLDFFFVLTMQLENWPKFVYFLLMKDILYKKGFLEVRIQNELYNNNTNTLANNHTHINQLSQHVTQRVYPFTFITLSHLSLFFIEFSYYWFYHFWHVTVWPTMTRQNKHGESSCCNVLVIWSLIRFSRNIIGHPHECLIQKFPSQIIRHNYTNSYLKEQP